MLVNNKFPKTIRMFIGHEDYGDDDDDDDDDAKRIFFAETDLVEQRFYKNRKTFTKFTIIHNSLRSTVRFVMKSSSLKLNEDNTISCVYFFYY